MALPSERAQRLAARTIEDFGEQWTRFPDSSGHFGSIELLRDHCEPLLPLAALRGARVAEIGSGHGRFVRLLLQAGAVHVHAVEPSAAMEVLAQKLADQASCVTLLHATGDALPPGLDLDFVLSIGVLHHVPDPDPVVRAAFATLRPGGRMLVWVYGREGNGLYLLLARGFRAVTPRLPGRVLDAVVAFLDRVLDPYRFLCRVSPRWLRLPLRDYVGRVLDPLSRAHRRLVIYDQLNPAYARYYAKDEARALLERAGFRNVRLDHRHGYSWTVLGEKA